MKRVFYLLAAASLLTVGCAKEIGIEPDDVDSSLIPLNIDGSINQVHTKATAAGFVDKDALGLFAVNYSEGNTVAGTLAASGNQADNVKYVFDESAYKWTPVKPVYYKDVNTNVDIYLYYPYQKSITDVNEAGFEVQKDQSSDATETELSGYEASDFLWGIGENVAPTEAKVAVSLTHRMSAVNVILAEKDGFEEGEFEALEKSIILTGTTRKAAIDYATGEVTPLGAAQLDGIVMCPQEDGAFRAVVVPQTVEAGVQLFAITIDGVAYSFRQSGAATSYQSGKQLDVTINITKKVQTGDYELELGDLQINPWKEDRNTHGGEARQYYVVNVETPGTLQATIEAAGKNPAKIRNLKVTGTITTEDFYFMRDQMTILEAINLREVKVVKAQTSSSTSYNLKDDVIPYNAFSNKVKLKHFVFPDTIIEVCDYAFSSTSLSGSLVLPDDVIKIGQNAFNKTQISSIVFPNNLEYIGVEAFGYCSSIGSEFHFPNTLKYIGSGAFRDGSKVGRLVLPDGLEYIGDWAFYGGYGFTGDLIIPPLVKEIGFATFSSCGFNGSLDLGNVEKIGQSAFWNDSFTGELRIPDGVEIIPNSCFYHNNFSSVVFGESVSIISNSAFIENERLSGILTFPEGLLTIEPSAFRACRFVTGIVLPSTLQMIGSNAFAEDTNISSITSYSIEPPTLSSGAFEYVAKDNFTVEVPSTAITRYSTEYGWSDFRRIAAHHDFSLSRSTIRTLNESESRTLVLRAPSNYDWSVDVDSLPDWISVTPSSGTGKTNVTITVDDMARTDGTFEVNIGTFNVPYYKRYKGRSGEVVFRLDDKDYSFILNVEQYDSDISDGEVLTYNDATKVEGTGIDIVFIGDGYDARDIASGKFSEDVQNGIKYFFGLEPYSSYKEYFNVYAVGSKSYDSGIGTENTVVDNKFGSYFSQNRILPPSADKCFTWAKKADPSMDLTKSLVIMLMNTPTYEGVTMLYGDGSAIACCPVSQEAYPYDFRGIIQHEAGGHGFGKLGDEYIYHAAFIQNCSCADGCDHGEQFELYKSLGWYKNMSMSADATQVPWGHLIYNPKYSDIVDMYEGGYMHSRGVYRSEATSCMNNNIPYYSAISRQAIVERIMEYAGETFDFDAFVAKDSFEVGTKSSASNTVVDRTFGVDPKFNRGSEHGSVIYMGEHPNVK